MTRGTDEAGPASKQGEDDTPKELTLRPLTTHEELREVEELQRVVWGMDDVELVPSAHLRAAVHAGGLLTGAFVGDDLIGFSYGFLASEHGRGMSGMGLHSHMVAVQASARGAGVGRALKWQQREWCLERGLAWISWTFDPLQRRNAHLNLDLLGAIGAEYLLDFYGPMGGPLGGSQPTDRLLAVWWLKSELVEQRRLGRFAGGTAPEALVALEARGEGKLAEPSRLPLDEGAVRDGVPMLVATPEDATHLLGHAPELAHRWRNAVGGTMTELFSAGYVATRLSGGAYVLEPLREARKEHFRE